MKRRSFYAAMFLLLGIFFAGLAISSIRAGESTGYIYAVVTVLYVVTAGGYWVHPEGSVANPDDPVPREWFALAGLVVATLVVSALLVFVAIG